ncbi:MAG TPA: glycosyltransferase family 2 protein [Rectinemataceae bacterium]
MERSRPILSVVVPVLDEEGNIEALASAIARALEPLKDFEIIFVDDGSVDGSLGLLRKLASENPRLRYLSFTRNFGHQAALRAGLTAARGERIACMDGDFQHPPELLPKLMEKMDLGFDVVNAIRLEPRRTPGPQGRHRSQGAPGAFKRLSSRLFYSLINTLSDTRISPGAADFRLLSRRAVDLLLSMKEASLFIRGALPWLGLPTAELEYYPAPRRTGHSKYSLRRMFSLALEGITSFSVRPLRLSAMAGAVVSISGFLYALYALGMRLFTSRTVEGWTSLLISLLLIGGLQLLFLGLIGEYLGKLFMEAKGRPPYVLRERSPDPDRMRKDA